MLSVSEKYSSAILADSREMLFRVTLAGAVVFDQNNITRMTIEESVSDSSGVSLGTSNSATLKVTLKDADVLDYSGMMVEAESGLVLSDGSVEWLPLGKFWVTNFSTSNDYKTINLTCADGMYLLTDEYVSELTYPSTIKNVVSEITAKTGVEFVDMDSLPDIIVRRKLEGATYREAVGYAAGCCGRNARFNRLGQLEFVWYTDTGITIERESQYLDGMTKLSPKPLDVNFEITGKQETYQVNIISGGNGGVTATPGHNVIEGETVVVSINPFDGYELAEIAATTRNGNAVPLYMTTEGGRTFIQPDSDVTINVSFRSVEGGPYKLTTRAFDNGSIMSYSTEYDDGESVTVYVTPHDGYVVDRFDVSPASVTLTRTGTTGSGELMYEFTMPQCDVTINAYFKLSDEYYPIKRIVEEGEGYIYVQDAGTKEYISEAKPGTLVGITFAAASGYALGYYISSVEMTQIGENTYTFVMPADEVAIHAYYTLTDDDSKTNLYSWLSKPTNAPPPTEKKYWAVFYKDDRNVPVWQKFHLVWFDSWSATGYNVEYGKNIYTVQFNGYYHCGSQNTGYGGSHFWDDSVWSGNGASGSTLEWDVYVGGHPWSGGSVYGSSSYSLLATNTHLYRNNSVIFEKCENAIQEPKISFMQNGQDVREKGSLAYWRCPDTFSTPPIAPYWMVVDAENGIFMNPSDYSNVGTTASGLFVVFYDSITYKKSMDISGKTFTFYSVTGAKYFALPEETSTAAPTYRTVPNGSLIGFRDALDGTEGLSDTLGTYHFCGLLVSSEHFSSPGPHVQRNVCRICDCDSEATTFSLRKTRSVRSTNEVVNISYTNPMIYEKMVPDISAAVQNISYTPARVKHRGNPAFQAGDIVTVPDIDGAYHTILIMQQTMTFGGGMNSEIQCPGRTNKEKSFSAGSSMSTQIQKQVEQSNIDLEHRLAANNALVFASLYRTISSTEAKIYGVVEKQGAEMATKAELELLATDYDSRITAATKLATDASTTAASFEARVSRNEAEIELKASMNDITGEFIIGAINDESYAKISADRLDIHGKELDIYVDATHIIGDVTVSGDISADQITSGTINVERIISENGVIRGYDGATSSTASEGICLTYAGNYAAVSNHGAVLKYQEDFSGDIPSQVWVNDTRSGILSYKSITLETGYYVGDKGENISRNGTITINAGSGGTITFTGTTNDSSDRRFKENISENLEAYEEFYLALEPVSYNFIGSTNGTVLGYIAQDVLAALENNGVANSGIVSESEDNHYYLNYNSFIALNTYMIQKLHKRVEDLENFIKKEGVNDGE